MDIYEFLLIIIISLPILVRIWTININIEGTYIIEQKGANLGIISGISSFFDKKYNKADPK